MHQLKIITSTTRPTSKGIIVARWITDVATYHSSFATELLDLASIALPLLDEPEHPRLQRYTQEHTKWWSSKINEADAFIVVLGEYNYGMRAPIKNALDYLVHEWKYKPMSFVTYGGVSGGIRSLQMVKLVVTALSMMPLTEVVNIQFFTKFISDGVFKPDKIQEDAAQVMLRELDRWATAFKTMRQK